MKNLFLILLMLVAMNASAQWTQCDGIYGGEVISLATSGSNSFAGTFGYGLWFTSNNGLSWEQSSLNDKIIPAVAISGIKSMQEQVVTESGYQQTLEYHGQTALNNQAILSLATSGNNIFAGTFPNGVWLSTNYGTTWTQTALNNQTIYSLAVSGNNVFAGTWTNGVWISTNNGTDMDANIFQ